MHSIWFIYRKIYRQGMQYLEWQWIVFFIKWAGSFHNTMFHNTSLFLQCIIFYGMFDISWLILCHFSFNSYWSYFSKIDFIEKNNDIITDTLESMAEVAVEWLQKSENRIQLTSKPTSKKRIKSISSNLKNESSALLEKLAKMVVCFKPTQIFHIDSIECS